MPSIDFPVETVRVRSTDDKWGPFSFDMVNGIPVDDALSNATVKSYRNDSGVESTSTLIETAPPPSVTGSIVTIFFNYPGAGEVGQHYLEFDLTFGSGAKHIYRFGYVQVEI